MKFGRFIWIAAVGVALSGCAMTSDVMDTGNGTYMISAHASPIRGGATGANNIAYEDAQKFCAEKSPGRGLQEMNVAFGGSLHPEIRDLPGRMNHRMPRLESGEIHPDPKVIFADRHDVRLTPNGAFAKLLGRQTIRVNSLHGQGILDPGERVVVEGVAEDGTI